MITLQWNALRTGDHVFVHDSSHDDMRLLPGVVAMVDTGDGSNDVGIRVMPVNGPSSVQRPFRLTVHLDPLDPAEVCWRCESIAQAQSTALAQAKAS